MALTIGDIYEMMHDKNSLTLYINNISARYSVDRTKDISITFSQYFIDRTEIPIQYMDYEITDIGSNEDGLVIHACVPYVTYEELDIRAKLNAIDQYVNIIHARSDFADVMDMHELEACTRYFWKYSDYTLDEFGNFYDETGTMIRR